MEIQNSKCKTFILQEEQLGELFKAFYAQWDFNGLPLKTLSCLMYDAYISENKDLPEINDASLFTMGFINMLRTYHTNLELPEIGKRFTKHILEPLQGGDPFIVEHMFYTCVGKLTHEDQRKDLIQFYRSVEDLLNGVKELNGEPIL